ncbi:hypothetical protein Micbo1qcDRAFT_167991 [Microdochium bolleyi]|uniref:Uncharacterized protein n=1 Tax=Microdochium bolleyi TaxID=196109 RepID=A0A136IPP1_9PEZI|nr:hypothetical protein Micbo1qcDRAFT_167991 [Microdochium bolleyi]
MAPPPPTASFKVATAIRGLQAASIVLASTASGLGAGLSLFAVPRILELPTHLLIRHFNRMLDVSNKLMPPMLLLPGIMNAVLAATLRWLETRSLASSSARSFASRASSSSTLIGGLVPWKFYAIAAGVSLSILPYTLVAMGPMDRMMVARNKYASREHSYSSSASSVSGGGRDTDKAADRLRKKVDAQEIGAMRRGEMSSHAIVDRWGMVNLYRPVVSLISAGIGIYVALW